MKFHITPTVFIFFLSLLATMGYSQNISKKITGNVFEATSNQPIEYATIAIVQNATGKPITGTITDSNGLFTLETNATDFYIEVSFMGYAPQVFRDFKLVKNKIDLGLITLTEDLNTLGEVLVRAEKSQTEFKLDKRVFIVGSDISSTGASSLEVLNSVPSVNVSIEGVISLRGSQGVQVLINGKPSVLASADGNALGTITADMIERIEVITNPSAKYNASGTAGIINIVIKSSEKRGLNGAASLNAGVPNSNSFGLSLNKRTEMFNLFTQLGFGKRTFKTKSKSTNKDFVNDSTITNNERSTFNEKFGSLLLGTDFHINDRNVLTLSGTYAFEIEDQLANSYFDKFFEETTRTDSWLRQDNTEATNPKIRYELQYKKDFKRHEDQDLLFSALGNSFAKDQKSIYNNTTSFGDEPNTLQETRTDYKLEDFTFKLDYTHPFLEKYTLETGSQYDINNVSNDFEVRDFINEEWISNPDLTNVFNFDQKVFALYSTMAFEDDVWGLKLGLRLESTNLTTELKTTNALNKKSYANFFPSVHTSYNIHDNFSLQLGYSKRISRPGLRQLNPFNNIRNNYSISRGNPDLQPEYTDSFELTSIHKLEKASLNFSLYNRYTTDVVENIISFENSISTSQPENIGTSNTVGFEFNSKYTFARWFTVTSDFNINYFNRKGEFELEIFDFKGTRWTTSLTSKFKLPKEFDLEVAGNYNSKFASVQGEISDNFFADMGVRKKILKGKFILNLSVRDVFATRVDERIVSQPTYYTSNSSKRGRFIVFGVSYAFGKGEAMEFSGQR
ncbi:TonB-dependent receptor domain-containing protein [Mariniflexile sp. AS56]|uniref:TonB-dependent receptor domain-containing protein n=1 Tax=Mariniflexile sp. AS56 TaxID=3063957 RepID=UPI0026EC529C|nr:TonB-dependent receptor [Mariniflexile sp. AS56]MDO7171443.1 TonB-dependent receptor [Mariniflexile sp. AS56]